MESIVLSRKKISEVVSSNIKTAHVFKKYGIDFCCGGGISIEKACEKNNVDLNALLLELNSIDQKVAPSQNYVNWDLNFLIDYIVNTHHVYVKESLGLIDSYAAKVAKVHGDGHPPVIKIYQLFRFVADELVSHMLKEETILFPYIRKIVAISHHPINFEEPPFKTVLNPIRMMKHEHETAGNILKEIAQLSNNYTPPDWACNTFKALYAKLDEFEQDLHLHVHLENNILFPKAIALEAELIKENFYRG